MTRVRAETLCLVNWKGVFWEQYALDPRVTALEGANGAGKTTVMIGAYIVLLPDLGRLRFSTLAETGVTGGERGIAGRLGPSSRPSYAALDLRLPTNERLVALVEIVQKAGHGLELTPMVMTGLSDETRLREVFLARHGDLDAVPERDELRELVATAGAQLKVFGTAKEYFAFLFERGVNPLRLSGDEERGKLNEMLRTSMIGGMSRALSGGMRDFLLKEEPSLGDTLRRMRANLDACRRTRHEVDVARGLEGEIRAVLSAGQAMFRHAVQGARAEADEARRDAQETAERSRAAEQLSSELAREHAELDRELGRLLSEVDRLDGEHQHARETVARTRRALELAGRVSRLDAEKAELAAQKDEAEAALAAAQEGRERARARADLAVQRTLDLSSALESLGLELLERQAREHRLTVDRLEAARAALGPEVTPERARELSTKQGALTARLDLEILANDREVEQSERKRQMFDRVHKALERMVGGPIAVADAYPQGAQMLQQVREREVLAEALPQLPDQMAAAQRAQKRQAQAKELAKSLATNAEPLASADAVHAAAEAAEARRQAAQAAEHEADRKGDQAAATVREATRDELALANRIDRWTEVRDRLDALARDLGRTPASEAELTQARKDCARERDDIRGRILQLKATADRLRAEWSQLDALGAMVDDRLVAARDLVGGELLAARFEDVSLDEAPAVEAALGPLRHAISVADLEHAKAKLAASPDRPDDLWLVGPDAHVDPSAPRLGDAVWVEGQGTGRLTRLPSRPLVGKKARAQRVAELREQEDLARAEIDRSRKREAALDRILAAIDALGPSVALVDAPDPTVEFEAARARRATAEAEQVTQRKVAADARKARLDAEARLGGLRRLLTIAHLIDEADATAEAERLADKLEQARQAGRWLREKESERAELKKNLEILWSPPPTTEAVQALGQRRSLLVAQRDRAHEIRGWLDWVGDHIDALAWADSERLLRERKELRPELQAQLEAARKEQDGARAALGATEQAVRAADAEVARARATLETCDTQLQATHEELFETAVAAPTAQGLAAAEAHEHAMQREAENARRAERQQREQHVRVELSLLEARRRSATAHAERDVAEARSKPLVLRWARFEAEVRERGLSLLSSDGPREGELASALAWERAKSDAAMLAERASAARDGQELAELARALAGQGQAAATLAAGPGAAQAGAWATDDRPAAFLAAWVATREWVSRRVPPDVAQVADPLDALAQLGAHLASLRARLAAQEHELRADAGSIAKHIRGQVRRARHQVQRLNEDLIGVSFGGIDGIRVRLQPVEHKEQVLQALENDAEAQRMLWDPDLSIEQALEHLIRTYGGGRSGGERLLDYRDYVELQVEVRRKAGGAWEIANPNRLSTGEAIGVGAAVMMTVLKAWEEDAQLLRTRRSFGTLRLLFLDEASRLSDDTLRLLFELCDRLELQLLIAAPRVDNAAGNTTYRLVRKVDAHGHEAVHVSGRRVIREAPVT